MRWRLSCYLKEKWELGRAVRESCLGKSEECTWESVEVPWRSWSPEAPHENNTGGCRWRWVPDCRMLSSCLPQDIFGSYSQDSWLPCSKIWCEVHFSWTSYLIPLSFGPATPLPVYTGDEQAVWKERPRAGCCFLTLRLFPLWDQFIFIHLQVFNNLVFYGEFLMCLEHFPTPPVLEAWFRVEKGAGPPTSGLPTSATMLRAVVECLTSFCVQCNTCWNNATLCIGLLSV